MSKKFQPGQAVGWKIRLQRNMNGFESYFMSVCEVEVYGFRGKKDS